jgi:outer membrane protein assembly factor BamD (BamD/ComL family)
MTNRLSDHEYRVAKYYIRISEYEPAMKRLIHLVNTYPSAPTEEDAYVLLVESILELGGRKDIANAYLAELRRLYPDNGDIRSLQRQIDRQ